ncbi:MAG TPA: Holliday junction branch migration protein RuvA [Rectinemataceae bacterium]|nr:Holliday junction branch migration protein RuvA [Rectinemataceae bacterium]
MFNSIRGILTERRIDSICVETGGVEWELAVPSRAVEDFGPLGSPTKAYTWLHHYEDGMRLFAFPSVEERALFLELLKVDGIGPNKAIHVLSGISPSALEAALEGEDLATLQKVPGVGPKVAQKMVLALKGKLVHAPDASRSQRGGASPWADVIKALVDMGFDRREAEAVVSEKAGQASAAQAARTGSKPEAGSAAAKEVEKEVFRLALLELSTGA